MTRRAVWVIGLGQCVNWGVLYYAFGVLIVPLARDLVTARWIVVGAFSVALLISAVVAPTIGRIVDAGHGAAVMQAGGLVAAGLLLFWAAVPNVALLYLIWIGLGVCMASTLYEPAFGMVGQAFADTGDRLRALATVTVFGGLASTVFLPVTQLLVVGVGWRGAVAWLAVGLGLSTLLVFRSSPSRGRLPLRALSAAARPEGREAPDEPRHLGPLMSVFACSSLVSAAIAINLVPALIDRHLSAALAAGFAGLFGVMQLPGRLLLMKGRRSIAPTQLLLGSFALQVAGLVVLAASRASYAIATGVTLFACGAGLGTLARPYLVLVRYGARRAGQVNGRIARAQHFARAAGPVAAAALAGITGYGVVFGLLAAVLGAAALVLWTESGNQAPGP